MSFELQAPPQTPRASDQTDASSLVDVELLEAAVKDMYRRVAREPDAPRHFEVGVSLALQLGYPAELIAALPAGASESFAGVGYHLDLAGLQPGARVLDLGSGSGTDVFCAALQVGESGRVVGVDFTDMQVTKATVLRYAANIENVSFVSHTIDDLPFADDSFDVVISNGVINLSPVKSRVFEEAARVLRPGGRLAIADIVSERPLREGTRRKVDLWAACIAGAIPRYVYLEAIEKAGFRIGEVRTNDYRFVSERAREAGDRYGVTSVSVAAVRRAD
jgi:arsenite methyltransferase